MIDSPAQRDLSHYWDDRYEQAGETNVSWFQPCPGVSLELIEAAGIERATPVIDVGGGGSRLVDHLLARGFTDVTVLDVSNIALEISRRRLHESEQAHWVQADVLTWRPDRRWDLWHDRAVFHFLANPADRDVYLDRLATGLRAGGTFIIGTFAADGPDRCSGLPVCRYDPTTLADTIVAAIPTAAVRTSRREIHTTPNGTHQPFTWITGVVDGGDVSGLSSDSHR